MPDADDGERRLDLASVGDDVLQAVFALERCDPYVVAEDDAPRLEVGLDRGGDLGRHDVRPDLIVLVQHGHVQPALGQRRGDLQPDEAGPDDDDPRRGAGRLLQALGLGQRPKLVDARTATRRARRRCGAGRPSPAAAAGSRSSRHRPASPRGCPASAAGPAARAPARSGWTGRSRAGAATPAGGSARRARNSLESGGRSCGGSISPEMMATEPRALSARSVSAAVTPASPPPMMRKSMVTTSSIRRRISVSEGSHATTAGDACRRPMTALVGSLLDEMSGQARWSIV